MTQWGYKKSFLMSRNFFLQVFNIFSLFSMFDHGDRSGVERSRKTFRNMRPDNGCSINERDIKNHNFAIQLF